MTIRETLAEAKRWADHYGPDIEDWNSDGIKEMVDAITSALTQLEALERDREAMEKLRADVEQGACPILVFDDAGKWGVSNSGTQPLVVKEPLPYTTVFLDDVEWFDDPADAILGTQEAQNDAD